MTRDTTEATSTALDALDHLLRSNRIKLAEAQRRRLAWLVGRFGAPTLHGHDGTPRGVIIVLEPPTGTGAERLARTLGADSVVAIPFGENPAFDFLKSKLTDFGTVGSCGASGPHELWWGGANWAALKSSESGAVPKPRIISCHAGGPGEPHGHRLKQAAARLGLDADIEPIETMDGSAQLYCFEKVEFIRRMWRRHHEPLLFVEADAMLNAAPVLPAGLDCDVALHRWNRWEISARTLYLGRTDAADALLRNWQHLAASYPQVWDGYLLDQAWSLTASQIPLDTVWLPRSFHAPMGDTSARHAAIIHQVRTGADLGPDPYFALRLRGARRAGRTGAGEALIVMTSPTASGQGVSVIVRDTETSDARAVAASVEAAAAAFANDSGGFGQFELSLCPWQDDVAAATRAAGLADHHIVEIAAGHRLPADLFKNLARAGATDRVVTATSRRD